MKLKLGTIIQLKSSKDEWNNVLFLIDYIDNQTMILVDQNKTYHEISMKDNVDIDQIYIIAHPDVEGYASQHQLLPNTWVAIEFQNDSTIYRGKIIDKIKDMIEVQLVQPSQIIYIDFEYKGLPRDKIKQIYISQEPSVQPIYDDKQNNDDTVVNEESISIEPIPSEEVLEGDSFSIEDILDIEEELDFIQEERDVSQEKRRYDIKEQTNDFLNDLLSTIPPKQRKRDIMFEIQIIINRFIELRELYSKFNVHGNIDGIRYQNNKPLSEILLSQSSTLPSWIIPVIKHKRNLFMKDVLDNYQPSIDDDYVLHSQQDDSNIKRSPFVVDDTKQQHVFIKKHKVESQQPVIVHNRIYFNNRDDTFLSTCINKEEQVERKYIIMKYIEDEIMSILSYVFLPPQLHSMTPLMNVLDRSYIAKRIHPIKHYLKQHERIDVSTPFVHPYKGGEHKKLLHFVRDTDSIEDMLMNEESNSLSEINENLYNSYAKLYIDNIIPDTSTLIRYYIRHHKHIYGVHEILKFLNYFHVQYIPSSELKFVQKALYKTQSNIKSKIEERKGIYSRLKEFSDNNTHYDHSLLLSEFSDQDQENILSSYKQDKQFASEYMFHMMELDHFSYICHFIMLDLMALYTNYDMKEILDRKLETIKQSLEGNNTCKNPEKIIAKTYDSISELNADDNKIIYFDLKHDDTPYDIIEEYKAEQESKSEYEFRDFLRETLLENGVTEDRVDNEVHALMNPDKKKKVLDNHYAILKEDKETTYFIRKNNTWVIEESENPNICNDKIECVSVQNGCLDTNNAVKSLSSIIIREIIDEDKTLIEEDRTDIERKLEMLQLRLEYIHYYRERRHNIYTKMRYAIGANNIQEEYQDIFSPYTELRDSILGIEQFGEKMKYLQIFIEHLTKESVIDKQWLYCISTNTKLLPSFYKQIVDAYSFRQDSYEHTLDKICAERGEKSEDGDKWVDKYSGYIIREIDSSTKEELMTSSVQSDYRSNLMSSLTSEDDKKESKEEKERKKDKKYIENVIRALEKSIGIQLNDEYDFVYQQTMFYFQATNLKTPSQKYRFMMVVIAFFMLITIQTSIPSIRTRKTFPNCKKSFSGYPYQKGVDESGLEYIVCVMKKISTTIEPWNSIYKWKKDAFLSSIKSFYNKKVRKTNMIVKQRIISREKYDKTYKEEEIVDPSIQDIWKMFLPHSSLSKTIQHSNEIQDSILKNNYLNYRKGSSKEQYFQDTLRSNLHYHIRLFQYYIQNTIRKENPLLKKMFSEPLLENSCCLENIHENKSIFHQYFLSKTPELKPLNLYLKKIELYLSIVRQSNKSLLFFSDADNRENREHTMSLPFSKDVMKTLFTKEELEQDIDIDELFQERLKQHQLKHTIAIKNQYYEVEKDENEDRNENNNDNSKLILDYIIGKPVDDIKKTLNTFMENNNSLKEQCISNLSTYFSSSYAKISDFLQHIESFISLKQSIIHSSEISSMLHYTSFLESCITFFINDIPSIVTQGLRKENISLFYEDYQQKLSTQHSVPKHWELSSAHNNQVRDIISKHQALLYNLQSNEIHYIDSSIFRPIKEQLHILQSNRRYFHQSSLHRIAYSEYYTYLFFHMLKIWNESVSSMTHEDMEEYQDIHKFHSSVLQQYMVIIMDHKSLLQYNEDKIKDKIRKQKDLEKDRKTEKLKVLEDDERQVTNKLKQLRLGDWSIGLQKGLKEYDPDFYDKEQEELVKSTIKDMEEGNSSEVISDFQDIYNIEEEQENEMIHLAEDDDYGDDDGDEHF